jgi:hypothetical protein
MARLSSYKPRTTGFGSGRVKRSPPHRVMRREAWVSQDGSFSGDVETCRCGAWRARIQRPTGEMLWTDWNLPCRR